jgi:hypothetical protein
MITAALSMFQVWVLVGLVIGKLLLDSCVKNIITIKSTCSWCVLASGWLFHCVPEIVRMYGGLKRAGRKIGTE